VFCYAAHGASRPPAPPWDGPHNSTTPYSHPHLYPTPPPIIHVPPPSPSLAYTTTTHPCLQAQLQELLEGYGIQSEAVDRWAQLPGSCAAAPFA
jgi:hypothetical protein